MIKPAKSKWPSLQLTVQCRTCDTRIKLTLHYGESMIWGNQVGPKLAEWAQHDGHDLDVSYEFYDGYDMRAVGR